VERRERYAMIEEQNGKLTATLEGLKVERAEVQEELRK
jgi:chromosome segregation ATPase